MVGGLSLHRPMKRQVCLNSKPSPMLSRQQKLQHTRQTQNQTPTRYPGGPQSRHLRWAASQSSRLRPQKANRPADKKRRPHPLTKRPPAVRRVMTGGQQHQTKKANPPLMRPSQKRTKNNYPKQSIVSPVNETINVYTG